jgi:DEAD/DEAH box helicase domain-containing protein
VQEAYPADAVSLRAVTSDNFVIVDTTLETEVIGEVDFSSALAIVHPKAIYLHQGRQYHVDRLDFEERKAYVKRVDVDYFTDAIRYTQVRVLETADGDRIIVESPSASHTLSTDAHATRCHGDVLVRSQVVGFKKIKFFTNENVGSGKLELPENEMHTTSFWLTLERPLVTSLPFSVSDRQSGMFGLLHALKSIATLLLMCDGRDLGTAIGERPTFQTTVPGAPPPAQEIEWDDAPDLEAVTDLAEKEFFEPNLYLYDAYPGGIGFSEPLYRTYALLLSKTRELIAGCSCEKGCPSCVGPVGERAERAKEAALAILSRCGHGG